MTEPPSPGPRHGRVPPEHAASRPSARASSRGADRGSGSIPRTTGSIPLNTGSIPRNTGAIPRNTGTIPNTTGAIPRNTGAIPRNTGSIPRNTGSIPRDTGSIPRTSGRHQLAPDPEPKGHPFAVAGALLAALLAIGIVLFALFRCVLSPEDPGPSVPPGQPVEVVIPQGAGGDLIVDALLDAGVIDEGTAFMQAVTSLGADQKLQPGTYRLTTGMDMDAVVRQLMAGPNTGTGRLTVPEGLTVQRTAEVVQEALGIPVEDFLAQAKASNFVDDYAFLAMAAEDSLEGFLWAKTYDFSGREISADTVIRAMLDQYQSEIPAIDFSAGEAKIEAAYGVKMSDYDILILASIIQKESTTPEDVPQISSVFYNRLRDGMRLQSDATMGYVTGGEPTPEDLQTDNPYNTYTRDGLPPTPICTPDLDCIEGALNPAATDYLYFLIIEQDGYSNHTFSRTYEEHLAAIDRANGDLAALG